jgi:flagellar hook-basal body complex protein FliE
MAIIPIGSLLSPKGTESLHGGSPKLSESSGAAGEKGFKDVMSELISNVEETEAITKMDAYKLSIGEADDLHTVMINAARADIALQTMVQLRNKVLEAYSEVMRINL